MRSGYPTDLNDNEWAVIQRYFPRPKKQGRPPEHAKRLIVNAILYVLRTGCTWRLLPNDFPPYKTVYHYFWLWRKHGIRKKIHDNLRQRTRTQAGREPAPSAGIIDRQSIKTTDMAGDKGSDGAKKVKGRKRHMIVDVMGMIISIAVTAASVQERSQARIIWNRSRTGDARI